MTTNVAALIIYFSTVVVLGRYIELYQPEPVTHGQNSTDIMMDPGWTMKWTHSERRCNGVDDMCCTFDTPCDKGDGDCDHDEHCARDLVCGENNCKWGGTDDCCKEKHTPPIWYPMCSANQIVGGYGAGKHYRIMRHGHDIYGSTFEECVRACMKYKLYHPDIHSVTMVKKSWNSRGAAAGCWCNHHSEYLMGRPGTVEYRAYQTCFLDKIDTSRYRCQGADDNCCTEGIPCKEFDGDCDYDSECEDGLVCGNDNCPWGKEDDCCVKPSARYSTA